MPSLTFDPPTAVKRLEDAGAVGANPSTGKYPLSFMSMPRIAILGLIGSLTLGLAACGNDSSTPTSPTPLQPPPPQSGPDLVVAAFAVSDHNPVADATFTLSATVQNDGNGAAASTTLRYYLSTDATITTADTVVGTAAVAGLAAAGSSGESVDLTAPATAGTYYYGACVDAVADESDTTNNCSPSVTVTVAGVDSPPPQSGPDLVVTAFSASDHNPVADATFALSATVQNDGNGAAASTTLRYYLSTDATITTADTVVGTAAVAGLAAAGSSGESVDLTAPATAGTYYYGACVDAVADESDTTNNCSPSVTVTVVPTFTGIRFSSELTNATQLEVGENIIFRVLATFSDGASEDVTADMNECPREGRVTRRAGCVYSLDSGRAYVDRVETGWRVTGWERQHPIDGGVAGVGAHYEGQHGVASVKHNLEIVPSSAPPGRPADPQFNDSFWREFVYDDYDREIGENSASAVLADPATMHVYLRTDPWPDAGLGTGCVDSVDSGSDRLLGSPTHRGHVAGTLRDGTGTLGVRRRSDPRPGQSAWVDHNSFRRLCDPVRRVAACVRPRGRRIISRINLDQYGETLVPHL